MSIEEISTELHSQSSYRQLTRDVVEETTISFVKALDGTQSRRFLIENYQRFNSGYCQSLMVTFPELWRDYSLNEWKLLFREVGPRPSPHAFDKSGYWTDCVFFSAFLRLNPFPLLASIQTDDPETTLLISVAEHFRKNSLFLFLDEDDDWKESFDGRKFCSLDVIDDAREKLLGQKNDLNVPYSTPDELREYLRTLS